jgi:hypothetical protein
MTMAIAKVLDGTIINPLDELVRFRVTDGGQASEPAG